MNRYLIIIVIAGTLGAIIAQPKSSSAWFVLGAILPLLLIAIAILPHELVKENYNRSRHCAKIVKQDAERFFFISTSLVFQKTIGI